MESDGHKKILTIAYAGASILLAVLVHTFINILAASSGLFARWFSNEYLLHGLPVLVAIIAFVVLMTHLALNVWAEEVVLELKKVVWPSRRDTTAMTIVVCVMVLISGLVLGVIDLVEAKVINLLMTL